MTSYKSRVCLWVLFAEACYSLKEETVYFSYGIFFIIIIIFLVSLKSKAICTGYLFLKESVERNRPRMSARNPLRQDLRVTAGLESLLWTDSFIQQMFLEHFLCAWPRRRVKGAVLLLTPYKAWLVAEEITYLHKKSNKDLTAHNVPPGSWA